MNIRFRDPKLASLYTSGDRPASRLSIDVIRQFMKLMQIIRTARDERDLRAFKGRRLEKLKGDRAGQYSMRVTDQFRLVFMIESGDVIILSLEDYH